MCLWGGDPWIHVRCESRFLAVKKSVVVFLRSIFKNVQCRGQPVHMTEYLGIYNTVAKHAESAHGETRASQVNLLTL